MAKKLATIELVGIQKKFNKKTAVSDIDLSIGTGEIVALLGPNGAGKTTLMRIITGFLQPNKGSVIYKGQLVYTKHPEYRSKIGYLPENNPLYTYMTVYEYLKFIANIKQVEKKLIQENIRTVVHDCNLEEVVALKIEVLSKGFKQRVGLAGAIMGDPEILILDEPTSGLDPNQASDVRSLIKKLGKKKGSKRPDSLERQYATATVSKDA